VRELMTVRETAGKLGVHRHTLRGYMRRGCPFLRASAASKILFDLAEVTAWLSDEAAKQAAVADRESVRGRMRRLVAPAPRTLTRKEIREATKSKRNAENRAKRGQWKLTKPAKPEKGDK